MQISDAQASRNQLLCWLLEKVLRADSQAGHSYKAHFRIEE